MFKRKWFSLDEDVNEVLTAIAENATKMREEADQTALNHQRLQALAKETEDLVLLLRRGEKPDGGTESS